MLYLRVRGVKACVKEQLTRLGKDVCGAAGASIGGGTAHDDPDAREDDANGQGRVASPINVTGASSQRIPRVASPEPHSASLPAAARARLDAFQKLLVIRVFREEKLVFAFRDFVRDKLGTQFVESAPLDLETVFKDTSAPTPIIFILSSGADPTGMLQRFGEKVRPLFLLELSSLD